MKWRNGDGWPANEVANAAAPVSLYSMPWSNYAWTHLGQTTDVLMCPVSPDSPTHPQGGVTLKGQILADYPINGHVVGFGGAGGSVTIAPTRVASVLRPSYTFLFVDGAFIALETYRDYAWTMGRHQGRMYAAHVDGHVADYLRDDDNYGDNQMPGGNMGIADFSYHPDRLHDKNLIWHMGPNGTKPPWPNGTAYPG